MTVLPPKPVLDSIPELEQEGKPCSAERRPYEMTSPSATHANECTETPEFKQNPETVYPDDPVQSLLAYSSLTQMNNVREAAAAAAALKQRGQRKRLVRISQAELGCHRCRIFGACDRGIR